MQLMASTPVQSCQPSLSNRASPVRLHQACGIVCRVAPLSAASYLAGRTPPHRRRWTDRAVQWDCPATRLPRSARNTEESAAGLGRAFTDMTKPKESVDQPAVRYVLHLDTHGV
jgi:hypothetical protein